MITPQAIREMLSQVVIAKPTEDGVRVSTHVLYPSNGAVSVVVRGGENSFVVSDEGGALSELISAGIRTIVADRMVAAQVRRRGLRVDNGAILSPVVPMKALPAAILLVANASRDVADWGLSRFPYHAPRSFKKDLAELLGHYFHDKLFRHHPFRCRNSHARRTCLRGHLKVGQ